jgi:predicted nucleic acid-binding protein
MTVLRVFVDTSALLAVLDADEPNHRKAQEIWQRLLRAGTPLHSTNYVAVETFAVAQNRLGMAAVKTLQEELLPVINLQ